MYCRYPAFALCLFANDICTLNTFDFTIFSFHGIMKPLFYALFIKYISASLFLYLWCVTQNVLENALIVKTLFVVLQNYVNLGAKLVLNGLKTRAKRIALTFD